MSVERQIIEYSPLREESGEETSEFDPFGEETEEEEEQRHPTKWTDPPYEQPKSSRETVSRILEQRLLDRNYLINKYPHERRYRIEGEQEGFVVQEETIPLSPYRQLGFETLVQRQLEQHGTVAQVTPEYHIHGHLPPPRKMIVSKLEGERKRKRETAVYDAPEVQIEEELHLQGTHKLRPLCTMHDRYPLVIFLLQPLQDEFGSTLISAIPYGWMEWSDFSMESEDWMLGEVSRCQLAIVEYKNWKLIPKALQTAWEVQPRRKTVRQEELRMLAIVKKKDEERAEWFCIFYRLEGEDASAVQIVVMYSIFNHDTGEFEEVSQFGGHEQDSKLFSFMESIVAYMVRDTPGYGYIHGDQAGRQYFSRLYDLSFEADSNWDWLRKVFMSLYIRFGMKYPVYNEDYHSLDVVDDRKIFQIRKFCTQLAKYLLHEFKRRNKDSVWNLTQVYHDDGRGWRIMLEATLDEFALRTVTDENEVQVLTTEGFLAVPVRHLLDHVLVRKSVLTSWLIVSVRPGSGIYRGHSIVYIWRVDATDGKEVAINFNKLEESDEKKRDKFVADHKRLMQQFFEARRVKREGLQRIYRDLGVTKIVKLE